MKITDIISKLPLKVKLNNNFILDDSFDKGTIVFVKSCEIEDWSDDAGAEACYISTADALRSLMSRSADENEASPMSLHWTSKYNSATFR